MFFFILLSLLPFRLCAPRQLLGPCCVPVLFVDGTNLHFLVSFISFFLVVTNWRLIVFRSSSAIPQLTVQNNETLYLEQEEAVWLSKDQYLQLYSIFKTMFCLKAELFLEFHCSVISLYFA